MSGVAKLQSFGYSYSAVNQTCSHCWYFALVHASGKACEVEIIEETYTSIVAILPMWCDIADLENFCIAPTTLSYLYAIAAHYSI
jgi:hypothetical protein